MFDHSLKLSYINLWKKVSAEYYVGNMYKLCTHILSQHQCESQKNTKSQNLRISIIFFGFPSSSAC